MSTEPDPQIVRDFARRAILSAAEDVDYLGIGEQFGDDKNWPQGNGAAYDIMLDAVYDAVGQATVTVSWPDEQPQDDGDVRAVAALLAADDEDTPLAEYAAARSAVRDRFADRIATLEARDAKGGEGQ